MPSASNPSNRSSVGDVREKLSLARCRTILSMRTISAQPLKLQFAKHPDAKQLVIRFIESRNPRDGKKTYYAKESEYEDDTLRVWPESGWFLRGLWDYYSRDAIHPSARHTSKVDPLLFIDSAFDFWNEMETITATIG